MGFLDLGLTLSSLFSSLISPSQAHSVPIDTRLPDEIASNISRAPAVSFAERALTPLPHVTLRGTPFSADILQFIHTPKTAGTNLDTLLKLLAQVGNFSYREFYEACLDNGDIITIPRGCGSGLKAFRWHLGDDNWVLDPSTRVVLGHMPVPQGHYNNASVEFFSIVRDPVDRLLSLGNFLYQWGYVSAEHLEQHVLDIEVDNLQTRMIAGEAFMDGPCTDATYAQAIENINSKFAFVAPIEEIDTVMSTLAQHFGAPHVAYTKTQIGVFKILTSTQTNLTEQLRARNSYDSRLYTYVQDYWQKWTQRFIANITHARNDTADYLISSPLLYAETEGFHVQFQKGADIAPQNVSSLAVYQQR